MTSNNLYCDMCSKQSSLHRVNHCLKTELTLLIADLREDVIAVKKSAVPLM